MSSIKLERALVNRTTTVYENKEHSIVFFDDGDTGYLSGPGCNVYRNEDGSFSSSDERYSITSDKGELVLHMC